MSEIKEYIYSPGGKILYEVTLTQNCKRKFSLMSEDSITLVFSLNDPQKFPVGSKFREFYITKEQNGQYNSSTGLYDYSLKFDAYYWLWANKVLKYGMTGVDSPSETSFSLTANIAMHAAVIEKAILNAGYSFDGSPFGVQISDSSLPTDAKLITYNNLTILGGIQEIATTFECEWWVIDNIVYFGKLENTNKPFEFEAGINVSTISFSNTKEAAPNRLYVFGSDRNLPTNYRQANSNNTADGIVRKRLMLPPSVPYIQTKSDIPDLEIVEAVAVLEDIYPRTVLKITEEPKFYTSTVTDEQNITTTETYYQIQTSSDFRFSYTYILPDEDLKIRFTSGLLNGMEFGVAFNPNGLPEKISNNWNPEAQIFEIVANEDYGRYLPDGILKPQKDDEFILIGWNPYKIANLGLIEAAEKELLEEGLKTLEECNKDFSTCTCPMAWDYMKPLIAKNKHPKPGDIVNVIDSIHFDNGGRKSRIIGYEYSLDIPYSNYTYVVGENISISRLSSVESKIDGLIKYGQSVSFQNGLDYISKKRNDETPFRLTMKGGARFGDYLEGHSGAEINSNGNAEFESIISRSYLQVYELIYNRLNALEGEFAFSDSATIENIENSQNGQRLLYLRRRWAQDFTSFKPGDIVYGIVNNLLTTGTYSKAWGVITDVNLVDNSITVQPYPENAPGVGANGEFTTEMLIAKHGNSIEPNEDNAKKYDFIELSSDGTRYINRRQSSFFISAPDGNIKYLHGVSSPQISRDNLGMVLGRMPKGMFGDNPAIEEMASDGLPRIYAKGLITQELIHLDYRGIPIRNMNYRGEWNSDIANSLNAYYTCDAYNYDVVSWNGSLWECIAPGTKQEPSEKSNSGWTSMLDRNLEVWNIRTSVDAIIKDANGDINDTLTISVTCQDFKGLKEIDDSAELYWDYDKYIFISSDGESEGIDDESGEGLDTEENIGLYAENFGQTYQCGQKVSLEYVRKFVDISLVDVSTGAVVAQKRIQVVTNGKSGDWVNYVFKQSDNKPDAPVSKTSYPGSEWKDAPNSLGVWWMSKSLIDGITGEAKGWSDPVKVTGEDGSAGPYTDFMYDRFREGNVPTLTDDQKKMPKPTGWYDTPPASNGLSTVLWMIQADKDSNGNLLPNAQWSNPVRVSGEQGPQGARGAMAYPAGDFDYEADYDASTGISPIVKYDDQYFILIDGKKWNHEDHIGESPAQNAVKSDPYWKLAEKFNTIFTDILLANFGKLSKAVFYDDYLFSALGSDYEGIDNENYQKVDEYLDILEGKRAQGSDYSFKPKLLINLRTGQIWGANLTAGNTVFNGEKITQYNGRYESITSYDSKSISKDFGDITTDYDNVNDETFIVSKFQVPDKGEVVFEPKGIIQIAAVDPDVKAIITLKYQILSENGVEICTWNDSFEITHEDLNSSIRSFSFNSRDLGIGTYQAKVTLNVSFTAQEGNYKDRYIRLRISLWSIEARWNDYYKSVYGANGFILGNNTNNYILAYLEGNGLNFIVENRKGYGLKVTNDGLYVKDDATESTWKSLEEYVTNIIKANNDK